MNDRNVLAFMWAFNAVFLALYLAWQIGMWLFG